MSLNQLLNFCSQNNNMVFHLVVQHFQQTFGGTVGKPHIIIRNLEHDSVCLPVHKMEEEGKVGEKMERMEWGDGERERERERSTAHSFCS